MSDKYEALRIDLQDYVRWYTAIEPNGYASRSTEQRMRDMGVKRHTEPAWDKKPWASNKETVIFMPLDIKYELPRTTIRKLSRIIPDLPIKYQKIIRLKFHPLFELKNHVACRHLGISESTYKRYVKNMYQEVMRRLNHIRVTDVA